MTSSKGSGKSSYRGSTSRISKSGGRETLSPRSSRLVLPSFRGHGLGLLVGERRGGDGEEDQVDLIWTLEIRCVRSCGLRSRRAEADGKIGPVDQNDGRWMGEARRTRGREGGRGLYVGPHKPISAHKIGQARVASAQVIDLTPSGRVHSTSAPCFYQTD